MTLSVFKKQFYQRNLFLLVVFIGILLRAITLDIPLYDDAAGIPAIGQYHDVLLTNILHSPHGVWNTLFFVIGMKLFGMSTIGIRMITFLFSLAYLWLLYHCGKCLFGERTARLAVVINLFTFFAFFNYFIIESDGIMASFFSLLIVFSFIKYIDEKKRRTWLGVSLLTFGFLVGMKPRFGAIIIPILFLVWCRTKNVKKSIVVIGLYLFTSLFVILISLGMLYVVHGDRWVVFVSTMLAHNRISFGFESMVSKILQPAVFIQLGISLSPLFVFLPLLTIKYWKKEYGVLYAWIIQSCVYMVLIPQGFSLIRFVSGALLPPLSLLTADVLSELKLSKGALAFIGWGSVVLTGFSLFLNNNIAADYWFFLTEMGPVIKVWQPIIYGVFTLCFFVFTVMIIVKKRVVRVLAEVIFFILALSFNMLLLIEPVIDRTHHDLIKEGQRYGDEKKDLGIVYAWNEDIAFYTGNRGVYIPSEDEVDLGLEFDANKCQREYSRSVGLGKQGYIDLSLPLDKIKNYILKEGGTVFLLNYPYKYVVEKASSEIKEKIVFIEKVCRKEKEKNFKTGALVIYVCPGENNK